MRLCRRFHRPLYPHLGHQAARRGRLRARDRTRWLSAGRAPGWPRAPVHAPRLRLAAKLRARSFTLDGEAAYYGWAPVEEPEAPGFRWAASVASPSLTSFLFCSHMEKHVGQGKRIAVERRDGAP
jgi:hypothetical protein